VRVRGGEQPAEVGFAHLAHAGRGVDHLDERLMFVGIREEARELLA
jgi:hypothetical protein